MNYALEGSVFVAGSAVQWLRDEMQFFDQSSASETLAMLAHKDSGVVLVPAFVGLGAPYWDDRTRGAIFGLTRGTSKADITRATLEALAYQTKDVLTAMEMDAGIKIAKLKVDGGASANAYLMQFQSDILQSHVLRPEVLETTALGAAQLAGLGVGFWDSIEELEQTAHPRQFIPQMSEKEADRLYARWQLAVKAARMFPTEDER